MLFLNESFTVISHLLPACLNLECTWCCSIQHWAYLQIRLLMANGETQKTDEDRSKEEKLIARLMEIVSQRNEVGETHEC